MLTINDIRSKFKYKLQTQDFYNGTIDIQCATFLVSDDVIFGKRNEDYIRSEIEWYESQSLNVNDLFDIYGKEVKIWKDVATSDGLINSNYGWAIYSEENGNQYESAKEELNKNPASRRGLMYYTRPTMHNCGNKDGMNDHMCTLAVQYREYQGTLEAYVFMRSNDAIFGFINDLAWQQHVLTKLAKDTNLFPGNIIWNAGSLHIYDRHWDLIK